MWQKNVEKGIVNFEEKRKKRIQNRTAKGGYRKFDWFEISRILVTFYVSPIFGVVQY